MFDFLKENPVALVGLFAVIDIIGIAAFIIYTVKKDTDKGKLKRIVFAIVCFVAFDAIVSSFIISSNTFYDKNGLSYNKIEDVKYYDSDGVSYTIVNNEENLKDYLVSDDGTRTILADRVYIDKNGFIVFDRNNTFSSNGMAYVSFDKSGNEYYNFHNVRWDKNGQIKCVEK